MEKQSETRDKFSLIQLQEKPPLYKKDTNLHLEGDLLLLTETREKYVPTTLQSRPKLTKKNTNLKLDGDLELMPEYKQFFVEHKCKPSQIIMPVNNLRTEGDYDMKTEHASRFTEHQFIHPIIPHLRESEPGKKFHLGDDDTVRKPEYKAKYVMYDKPERRTASKPKSNLTQEGEIDTKTENKIQFVVKAIPKRERQKSTDNISLEGEIDMNPEYKNAYVDFYASSAKSLPLPERRKPPQSHLNEDIKMENGINSKPEYRSSYVDFPRQRPSVKKPETHLAPQGNLLLQTEKREKYVPYSNVPRVVPIRRKPELSLEGPFECQPEYRKAYQAYLIRETLERKQRPFDNLSALQAAEKVPSARKSENLQVPDKEDIGTAPSKIETQTLVSKTTDNNKPITKPTSTNNKKVSGEMKAIGKSTNKKSLALLSSQQQTDNCNRIVTKRHTPRKFDKFIEVPNLAYKDPYYSPISSLIHTPATTTPRCLSPVNLPSRFLSPQTHSPSKTSPHKNVARRSVSSKSIFPGRNLSQKGVSSRRPVPKSVSPRRLTSQSVSSKLSSPKRFSPKILTPQKVSSKHSSPTIVSPRRLSPKSTPSRCLTPRNVPSRLSSHKDVSSELLTPRPISPDRLSSKRVSSRSLTPRGTSPRRSSLKSVSPRCMSPGNITSRDLGVSWSGSPGFLTPKADSTRFISRNCVSPRFISPTRCFSPKLGSPKKILSRRNSYESFNSQCDISNDRFIRQAFSSKDQIRVGGNGKSFIVIKDDLNNNDVNGFYDSSKNHEISSYDEENILTSWDSAST